MSAGMSIIFPESAEKYIQLQCNGDKSLYTDMPEMKWANEYICKYNPKRALDIGSGIGRASVFISKNYLPDCWFYLLDGDGGDKQFDGVRVRPYEYYNSFGAANEFCSVNNVKHTVVDAGGSWIYQISNVDLVFSFLAIGFHWPLSFYLNCIYEILNPGRLAVFGMRGMEADKWVNDQIRKISEDKFEIFFNFRAPTKTRESLLVLRRKK